jgi:hypothetical protein
LQDGYLMVIPAMINGIGPFNFLLDTGTTQTVIDPDLARQLQTPTIGDVAITTVLHMRQDKLVQLRDVSLGHSSVAGLGAVVDKLARQKILAPGIRGVLGENFYQSSTSSSTSSSAGCALGMRLLLVSDVDSRQSVSITAPPQPIGC